MRKLQSLWGSCNVFPHFVAISACFVEPLNNQLREVNYRLLTGRPEKKLPPRGRQEQDWWRPRCWLFNVCKATIKSTLRPWNSRLDMFLDWITQMVHTSQSDIGHIRLTTWSRHTISHIQSALLLYGRTSFPALLRGLLLGIRTDCNAWK